MISQSDIIRTLVNKNCTDESIMTTALSPNCTPSKLLDKFTETERFDLALDVSMKLGRDVLPLWKTWAMLCLKNRNFQGARDKFRHCFLRLKASSGRISSASSVLLEDILRELIRMDESKLSLVEEIASIKQGKHLDSQVPSNDLYAIDETHEDQPSILKKPKIFAECLHYINEYGDVEDKLKFYVKNSLWTDTIDILLDPENQINEEKFFIVEVVLYLASTGRLDDFVSALKKRDPDIKLSGKYYQAIYDFCTVHRRYNLLYYIQTTIGDYVAAAKNQICHFFLKKPTRSYKELNCRLTNLIEAKKNYQDYLRKTSTVLDETECKKMKSSIISYLSADEVEWQLEIIEIQIEITRNFAINEVSGCMNGLEIAGEDNPKSGGKNIIDSDDTPVTLFEESHRRRVFLAALVLIYFDVDCSTNFSKSGLELANQLIHKAGLDKLRVFKTAMRLIIEDESCDILENASLLLDLLKEDYLSNVRPKLLAEKRSLKQRDAANKQSRSQRKPSILSSTSTTSSISSSSSSSTYNARVKSLQDNQPNNTPTTKTVCLSLVSGGNSPDASPLIGYQLTTDETKNASEAARAICDEVIRDAIGSCREPDYKMELAKLLSSEAKIELYIELGKLSNAQTLAFSMNRPDYVSLIIDEAAKRNQNHVKTVCQLWLAKSS